MVTVVPVKNAPSAYDLKRVWSMQIKDTYKDNNVNVLDNTPLKLKIEDVKEVESFYYSRKTTGANPLWINTYVYIIETKEKEHYIIECLSEDIYNGQRAKDIFKSIVTSFEKN